MAIPTFVSGDPIQDFFYILFNGIAEVPLVTSPVLGILILVGTIIASRKAGLMLVISGLVGSGTALLLGAPYELVVFGLFGYNACLTAAAFWSGPFIKTNKASFFLSVFGAAVSAIAWMGMAHVMGDMFSGLGDGWAIPGFTAAFIFTTWILLYASKNFGHDIWPTPPEPKVVIISGSSNVLTQETVEYKWTAAEFGRAVLKSPAQILFCNSWKAGIFWIVGLTLSFQLAPQVAGQMDIPWWTNGYATQWDNFSPLYLGGVMAMIGGAIGTAQAIILKLPADETRAGLHGFNQVLLMIALTSFLPLTPQLFVLALFATVVCGFVMVALQRFFGIWGLPALAGPFVLTVWITMLGIASFDSIPGGITGWSKP